MLNEHDLKTIKNPLYACLKEDIIFNRNQKMMLLTPYGVNSLEKNGIFLNNRGQPKISSAKLKDIQRTKQIVFTESNRVNEQKVKELDGLMNSLISKYYSKPNDLVSNRSVKQSKKNMNNYIYKCSQVFLKGDRQRFDEVSKKIDLIADLECRPTQELIFKSLFKDMKRKLDQVRDKPPKPAPYRW